MPQLSITTVATDTPMGAQAYQRQVTSRAADALDATGGSWSVHEHTVRSLRSALPGDRRLPLGRLARASASTRAAVGRLLYRGDDVSHRMTLELPPSPHADVATLHDVVAWRFPDESGPVHAAAEELRRSAAVICVSAFTAAEAHALLGIRDAHVVPNGVDPRYFDAAPLAPPLLQELGLDGPFVLHAGGAARRKNLHALADAWPLIHRERPELRLALAGPEHPERTALFDGQPGVRLLGRLSDERMPGLVAAAAVVVVPSLYEGFGLPVLEAMAANVPVVAANTSSLPEVAGGHAILTEPDAAAIAAGIIDATAGGSALRSMIIDGRAHAAQYTWERSAAAHARIWNAVR